MDGDGGSPEDHFSPGASDGVLPRSQKVQRRRQTTKDRVLRGFAKTMRHAPTDAEAKLWAILWDRRFAGCKFRRQMPIGGYIADFVCFDHRLVVEVDGSQHHESRRDEMRDAWFRSQGFRTPTLLERRHPASPERIKGHALGRSPRPDGFVSEEA